MTCTAGSDKWSTRMDKEKILDQLKERLDSYYREEAEVEGIQLHWVEGRIMGIIEAITIVDGQ